MKLYLSLVVILSFSMQGLYAQQNAKTLTAADYDRAVQKLDFNTSKLVYRNGVNPRWLPDGTFYYSVSTPSGMEWVLIDPATGTRKTGATLTALVPQEKAPPTGGRRRGGAAQSASPDGKKAVFIRDWNLWAKDISTGKEWALTTDGVQYFGYATDNAGWVHSNRPIVAWSPDSKKVATFQQDERLVTDMYLVRTKVGKPELEQWKYPLAGDQEIVKMHRVIIDVDNPAITRLHMGPDAHRSTLCDDISCDGGFTDNVWSSDGKKLAFVSTSRDHKQAKLRVADVATGEVKDIFDENVNTQYESGQGNANWTVLHGRNEFIWYSERDNWGHLYRYDLATGKLKNQITKGDFVVTRMLHVDEKSQTILFEAKGREAGRHPYYAHYYSIKLDGTGLQLLTPEDADHSVSFSPDFKYFVDNYSQTAIPTVSVLRSVDGKVNTKLEAADITALTATGWKAPEIFKVTSADGQWDLYGHMYTPSVMEPGRKYPVVNYIYPGPQGGSVRNWGFTTATRDNQALAELGFVVIAIEGSCNPDRSKAFHDACYGSLAVNTLPDQMSGIRQLATRYPFIDLDRVGVWGHSGGGSATTAAMFRYPDFYKVGIAESGNHDNRNYEDDWAERYVGLEQKLPNGRTNYEEDAVAQFSGNLKGKLLLAHGGMDDNVPPYHTYLVVDALVKANKDFDLLIFPNARHGFGEDSYYMMRRRWDYFVTHLQGNTPPAGYKISSTGR